VTSRNKSTDAIWGTADGVMELGLSQPWNAGFYLDRADFQLMFSKYSPSILPWIKLVFSLNLSKYGALGLYILGNITLETTTKTGINVFINCLSDIREHKA
jgi:hypothetical protein